jgi:hypothetical protein
MCILPNEALNIAWPSSISECAAEYHEWSSDSKSIFHSKIERFSFLTNNSLAHPIYLCPTWLHGWGDRSQGEIYSGTAHKWMQLLFVATHIFPMSISIVEHPLQYEKRHIFGRVSKKRVRNRVSLGKLHQLPAHVNGPIDWDDTYIVHSWGVLCTYITFLNVAMKHSLAWLNPLAPSLLT